MAQIHLAMDDGLAIQLELLPPASVGASLAEASPSQPKRGGILGNESQDAFPVTVCVYMIKNINTGKFYIGSAKDFKGRVRGHRRLLNKGCHHSIYMQRAWGKYGSCNFLFVILERVNAIEDLIKREQFYIDKMRPAYNTCKIAGSRLGCKANMETRRKLSMVRIGNKNALGYRHTEETKRKIAEASRRKVWSDESREKLSASRKGQRLTEETRRKLSEARKGIRIYGWKPSDETRAKWSRQRKGRPWTPKQREASEKFYARGKIE